MKKNTSNSKPEKSFSPPATRFPAPVKPLPGEFSGAAEKTYSAGWDAEEKRKQEAEKKNSAGKKSSFLGRFNVVIGGGVTTEDKIMFARTLSAMLKAGLPLSRALAVLTRQERKPAFGIIVENLHESIIKGNAFHAALAAFPRIFPPLFVAMAKAGEESGTLSEALATIETHLKKGYELRKRVQSALIYPAIIIVAIIIVAVIMLLYVVPVLSETFKELGVDLPVQTRVIIAISDFSRNSASIMLGIFAALLLLVVAAAKTKKGKRFWDWSVLHVPLVSSLVKQVNAARTARTLSSLLSAGVPMIPALAITEETSQNSYYVEALKEAQEKTEKGAALSSIFVEHETIYPPLLGEMTAVGEETGKMSELLVETALFYEEEVDRATKDLSSVIEPLLMVVMGVAVGFFALSMITPMYSLVGSI